MTDTLALAKITDRKLRRFVDQHGDGKESVLIHMNVRPTMVRIGPTGSSWHAPPARHIVSPDRSQEEQAVEKLKELFDQIGVKARYMNASHSFSARTTSTQLSRIVHSDKVLSVAPNRTVRHL